MGELFGGSSPIHNSSGKENSMENFGQWLVTQLTIWVPRVVAALLILLVGWLIARLLAELTRRLLKWI
jgi:hypothetical protein